MRLRELAAARMRVRLSPADGVVVARRVRVTVKRIYRLYTEVGLTVRAKMRVKAPGRHRVLQAVATAPNQGWSVKPPTP